MSKKFYNFLKHCHHTDQHRSLWGQFLFCSSLLLLKTWRVHSIDQTEWASEALQQCWCHLTHAVWLIWLPVPLTLFFTNNNDLILEHNNLYMCEATSRVLSHPTLAHQVWKRHVFSSLENVDKQMGSLGRGQEKDPCYISLIAVSMKLSREELEWCFKLRDFI